MPKITISSALLSTSMEKCSQLLTNLSDGIPTIGLQENRTRKAGNQYADGKQAKSYESTPCTYQSVGEKMVHQPCLTCSIRDFQPNPVNITSIYVYIYIFIFHLHKISEVLAIYC